MTALDPLRAALHVLKKNNVPFFFFHATTDQSVYDFLRKPEEPLGDLGFFDESTPGQSFLGMDGSTGPDEDFWDPQLVNSDLADMDSWFEEPNDLPGKGWSPKDFLRKPEEPLGDLGFFDESPPEQFFRDMAGNMGSDQHIGNEQPGISQLQNVIQYSRDAQMNSAEDTAQKQNNTDNASRDYQAAFANEYYDSQEKAAQQGSSAQPDGSAQTKDGTNAPPPQSDDAGSDQKTRSQTMADELLKKWRPADMNNWDAAWAGRWAAQEIVTNQQWDKLPNREDCDFKDPFWQTFWAAYEEDKAKAEMANRLGQALKDWLPFIWGGINPFGDFWKGMETYHPGIKTDGNYYYTWDYSKGHIETFDKTGKHIGVTDPVTGALDKSKLRSERSINVK